MTGIWPLVALMNHSCAPSVAVVPLAGRVLAFVAACPLAYYTILRYILNTLYYTMPLCYDIIYCTIIQLILYYAILYSTLLYYTMIQQI